MNKKNGFTLVELLAVIVIIGVLFSISTIAINSIKKKEDLKNAQNVISSIFTGAKRYEADHQYPYIVTGSTGKLKIEYLISGGYVEFDTTKYSDLVDKAVIVKRCQNPNSDKLFYAIIDISKEKYGNGRLNDCGCLEQSLGTTESKKLCTGTGGI